MRLYHHCRLSDLESIAEKGLYPHIPKESAMSLGQEVVWLTEDPSTDVTEADLDHWRRVGASLSWIWKKRVGMVGCWIPAGRIVSRSAFALMGRNHSTTRRGCALTVISRSSMKPAGPGPMMTVSFIPQGMFLRASVRASSKNGGVYFGRVPRSAIEGLPPRQAKRSAGAAEDTALDIALNKFIHSETCRRQA